MNMKRTTLSLLVVGLFAGFGTSAIADDVKTGSEPKENSRAIAPIETDSTAQKTTKSDTPTKPAKEEGGMPANDSTGNSSNQAKYPK
jgi:hypothetical protein